MVSRANIIIQFSSKKAVSEIQKLIPITYVSYKMKYIVAYCDKKDLDITLENVKKVKHVSSAIESLIDMSVYDFKE